MSNTTASHAHAHTPQRKDLEPMLPPPEGSLKDHFKRFPCGKREPTRIAVGATLRDMPNVCQHIFFNRHDKRRVANEVPAETLVISHAACQLCIVGTGFESRANSTASMVVSAVRLLERSGTPLAPFKRLNYFISDVTCAKWVDLAYAVQNNHTCAKSIRPVGRVVDSGRRKRSQRPRCHEAGLAR